MCVLFIFLYTNCKNEALSKKEWTIKVSSVPAQYPYSKVIKCDGYKNKKICMMQTYASFFKGKIVSFVITRNYKEQNNTFYPTYDEKISFLDTSLCIINKKYQTDHFNQLMINLDLWQELYNIFTEYYDSNNFKHKFKSTKFYKDISFVLNENGYKIKCFTFDDIYIQEYNKQKIITGCCTFDIIKKQ